MDTLVIGLLASLGFVIGLAFAFLVMYRHHLRRMRRANRLLDPLSRVTSARQRALPFHLPTRWLAVRSSNTAFIRALLGSSFSSHCAWSEALSRHRDRSFFLSSPVDGWTLVVGGCLPEAGQDVDQLYRFLTRLSREIGQVQYFSFDRVLNFHAWARLEDGVVRRAYAWAGETLWNEGRLTLEERLLGLRCRDYAEEIEPLRYGEVAPEMHNTERVMLLARRWSLDLLVASELLLQQEAVESGDGESGADGHR